VLATPTTNANATVSTPKWPVKGPKGWSVRLLAGVLLLRYRRVVARGCRRMVARARTTDAVELSNQFVSPPDRRL
jgi:hypothetical protein